MKKVRTSDEIQSEINRLEWELKELREELYAINNPSYDEYKNKWDAMKEQKRVPFCFVTPGGDWVECAEMGWFGMTFNDKDPKEWDEEFWNYVDSLHDEIPVTVVDFHI